MSIQSQKYLFSAFKNANWTDISPSSSSFATLAKATLTASTGISITNGNGSISITNSAPDQTVALTGGTGISTSGTYPNFTITNDSPNQATPAAGSSGQLQYNDGSNGFTATSDMVYTTDQLKVQNIPK